jgi:hypothetical protein
MDSQFTQILLLERLPKHCARLFKMPDLIVNTIKTETIEVITREVANTVASQDLLPTSPKLIMSPISPQELKNTPTATH